MPSDYHLSRPLAVRLLGSLVAIVGGLLVVWTVVAVLLDLPTAAVLGGIVVAALLVATAAVVLLRRVHVVRLDEAGYRVRLVRGAGVAGARWTDVEDVVATTVAGERCIVLRLRDGRTTTIPVRVLGGGSEAFVADLQDHLNRGHGYRRIR